MFHKHKFKPLETDEEKLYCECGKVKDIHRCIWKQLGKINGWNFEGLRSQIGVTLQCKKCGDLKAYRGFKT